MNFSSKLISSLRVLRRKLLFCQMFHVVDSHLRTSLLPFISLSTFLIYRRHRRRLLLLLMLMLKKEFKYENALAHTARTGNDMTPSISGKISFHQICVLRTFESRNRTKNIHACIDKLKKTNVGNIVIETWSKNQICFPFHSHTTYSTRLCLWKKKYTRKVNKKYFRILINIEKQYVTIFTTISTLLPHSSSCRCLAL